MDIKEAFLYLNRLIMDHFIQPSDAKSMEEELQRRFVLCKPEEAKYIVELYQIARNSIVKL